MVEGVMGTTKQANCNGIINKIHLKKRSGIGRMAQRDDKDSILGVSDTRHSLRPFLSFCSRVKS